MMVRPSYLITPRDVHLKGVPESPESGLQWTNLTQTDLKDIGFVDNPATHVGGVPKRE
ncbi:hypothetical protein AHAS_Ahas01G0236900 [Arachis hypogaea]